jgi:hypothetical protein
VERRLPRIFLALLAPIYLIYLFAPGFGHFHDDGVYLSTAHALANGKGYIHESLPVVVPQTKYPFLYPALLVPFWLITISPFAVAFLAKLLSFFSLVAWTIVTRRLVRHWLPNEEAIDWISFFSLAAPWTLYLGTSALPDALFALLCALCLSSLLRIDSATGSRHTLILLAASGTAAAAFLIRTTGLAIVLAAFVYLLRRRPKDGIAFLAVCALLCAPWLLWQALQTAPLDPVLIYYSKLSYAKGQILSGYSPQQMLIVFLYNAVMLITPFLLWAPAIPFGLALAMGLLLGALSVIGLIRCLRQGEHLGLWVTLYTGILLCWIWPPYRYVFPAMSAYLLLWGLGIQPLLKSQWRLRSARYALASLAVLAIFSNAASAKRTLELGSTVVGWADADNWEQQVETLEWIRSNTPKSAVFSANLDPVVFLLTQRKAVKPFEHLQYELHYGAGNGTSAVGTPAEILQHLQRNGVTHVLVSPMNNFREKRSYEAALGQILRTNPLVLRKVHEIVGSGYAVFEVDRSRLSGALKSCADPALRTFSSRALLTAPSNASN